jgi:hypothetical protein
MRVKVDKENKVVVVTGHYMGDKIKAISRCKGDDQFDEKFGVDYTISKWKEKLLLKKIRIAQIDLDSVAKYYTELANDLDNLVEKFEKQEEKTEIIISNKYGELGE